jgi:uncharacterized glyoxalase superfamily protein PhnB
MTSIDFVTLEVADAAAAADFYEAAFGIGDRLRFRESDAPSSGFRGYTLSVLVSQPANVRALHAAAVGAGAKVLKPVERSMWGYGGVVQAPDGGVWTIATSEKSDSGPAAREIDSVVLLLTSDKVKAAKRFYQERGIEVAKSFGSYVEFEMPANSIGLGLYTRKALAKVSGLSPEGTGSHRLVVHSDLGAFTDPEGFVWEPAS